MSSSTSSSSSRERRFLVWVLLGLAGAIAVCSLDVWTGVQHSHRRHLSAVERFGAEADYLILGDSKTGPFSHRSLSPVFARKGLVFDADSVTPSYHLYNFRKARERVPAFEPRVVFICLGANNFNQNGLHGRRDIGLFGLLPLTDVARLTLPNGEYLSFAEAVLSRIFPIYQKRVQITHFNFAWKPDPRAGIDWDSVTWPDAAELARTTPHADRDPIADRNYLNIYRRSVYNKFAYSEIVESALDTLIGEIEDQGGRPVLVLLPVAPEMRELEHELVGPAFDGNLGDYASEQGIQLLDLRDETRYELADVNHLSERGALDFFKDHFQPILEDELERHVSGL